MKTSLPRRKKIVLGALAILFAGLSFAKLLTTLLLPNADESFEAFTRELFRQELSASTISLHYTLADPSAYGIETVPVTYGEFCTDPAQSEKSIDVYLTALSRFSDANLSEENQLTYQILTSYLKSSKKGLPYILYQEPLSPVVGLHAQLPLLLSEYRFYSEQDVLIYLELLDQTDEYFDSILSFEQQKCEEGLFMPDYQIDTVISYCKSFIETGDSNFLISSFDERLDNLPTLSNASKANYAKRNQTLIDSVIFPAYQTLISFLKAHKGSGQNDAGLCFYPDGSDYYEYLIQQEAGVSESIPELKKLIFSQIMDDLQTIQEVALQANNDMQNASPEQMVEHLKSCASDAFPYIPEVEIDIKYVSSSMEEYLSPAFYMIPAIDNSSENVIYINKGQTLDGLNLYTTLAHEGYPGHLYQTVYFHAKKPAPIRSLLNFGGYVEGWATYAEMMSYYFAPLSSEEATLLQKQNSLILGLYAYADLGIHYDGWSLPETVEFFKKYGFDDTETVEEIYELIIGTPGNYSKYYLGYLKIYNLKKEIAKALGKDFSQIAFHKALLDVGPAPFTIVEEYVKNSLL